MSAPSIEPVGALAPLALAVRALAPLAVCVLAALGLALAGCGDPPAPSSSSTEDAPELARVHEESAAAAESSEPASASGGPARPRGLWVLCEGSRRVLDEPERVEQLIVDAQALGVTDLFVQVYRGGRAWYDATLADPAPYLEIRERTGVDTLALLLDRASEAGLKVHAWVNVLSLSRNPDALVVRELGRAVVHVDRFGRSLLDYPGHEVPKPDGDWYRMGTRGVYLDPAAPGLAAWLAAAYAELVSRYPGLAGLHLDYIRHPDVLPFIPGSRFGVGLDFGYGPLSRERYRRETGLDAPGDGRFPHANRWDEWRREQVTAVVAEIRKQAVAARPGLVLSAAVASHVDRAYFSLFQDWQRWLEEGLLELAVPMAYTLDDRILRYHIESFSSGPHAERIWIGLGSWLFAKRPGRALAQVELVAAAGAAGDSLFSYDSIFDAPELLAALAAMDDPREP